MTVSVSSELSPQENSESMSSFLALIVSFPAPAVKRSASRPADQHVACRPAGQDVEAGAAIESHRDRDRAGVERVIQVAAGQDDARDARDRALDGRVVDPDAARAGVDPRARLRGSPCSSSTDR